MKDKKSLRLILASILVFLSVNASAQKTARTVSTKEAEIERKINALLAKMTLAETVNIAPNIWNWHAKGY